MKEHKISVVVPVYNEEKVVEATINEIKKVLTKSALIYEIIAVNDGSKDKSGQILDKIKGIKVIHNPYNLGYGASIKNGIKLSQYEWILIIDSDGTYPINQINNLIKNMGNYDMVVGARTGEKVSVPLLRRPAKFILTRLANFLSGKPVPDINSGLRIFKKEIALKYFNLFPSGFSFTITITLACLTNDYPVKYIPINYYKRKGKSTIHPLGDFIGFINTIVRVSTYFNPLKIFSLVSFFLFFVAIAVYIYAYLILNKLMDITVVILVLASLQIFLLGLIADILVKKSK